MKMTPPGIGKIIFGRNACSIGIGQARPTISWRFTQDESTTPGFKQSAYEIRVNGKTHHVESSSNIDAPWPSDPLASRQRVLVGVRACDEHNSWTPWAEGTVEAGLLDHQDWTARMITGEKQPESTSKRPIYLRKEFDLKQGGPGRIYATAFGVYTIRIDGKRIGDHILAPGWQSYHHRLHYQTYQVDLGAGSHIVEITVGEGWYAGRLTWTEACRNYWGSEIGARCQLEVGDERIVTDTSWKWSYGPLITSELYDGETYDSRISHQWSPTRTLPIHTAVIAPEAPPIRRIEEIAPVEIITTPSGKKILDFGQNLVGWVKIRHVPATSNRRFPLAITLRHAEVLDKGELGVRPLRTARAIDKIFLGDELTDWEPEFTTHGFRYAEVTGCEVEKDNFVAVVVHSDMERLGQFESSHATLNQLHSNVVWGLKGNFVGVPTDCPQRDERLGWTGDLQVFAPTASFLYDTSGMLSNWLHDLAAEQLKDNKGVPPLVIPSVLDLGNDPKPFPQAVWGDVCTMTPSDLYDAYGSKQILEEQWQSMTAWLEAIPKDKEGLWDNPPGAFQLADWLDPKAPPDRADMALTDPFYVADAYLVHIDNLIARIARILGKKYTATASRLAAFRHRYVTPAGRLASDTQTAHVLALQFDLLSPEHTVVAADRLVRLIQRDQFRIGTGFAGTSSILMALAKTGHLQVAYRMLQEKECPSWFYPITMGATTIWERWDSLLPDGSINPGEMTSFNHYALGSVAHFLHSVIGGISPAEPGWQSVNIHPRPGGTVTSANTRHVSPQGTISCEWAIHGESIDVKVELPPNTTAKVTIGSFQASIESGYHHWNITYEPEGAWPPIAYAGPVGAPREPTYIP